MKTALLLSGGMDSIALAWWKKPDVAITIDYGQLAAQAEITASKTICKHLKIPHHIVTVDCKLIGSGDMAGGEADKNAPASDWWPYRNQLLITLACMKLITLDIKKILLGTVKSDHSHLDGTPEFINKINEAVFLQEGGILIEAPAIQMTTAELIEVSGLPSGVLAWAHSCHKSDVSCGNCRGCNKYFEVFSQVGYALDKFG